MPLLLLPASPAIALVTPPLLPTVEVSCPTLGYFRTLPLGQAGASFDTATRMHDGETCGGTLIEHVDERDWYRFWASPGTTIDLWLVGSLADLGLCLYRPTDALAPVACSREPGSPGEGVWFPADESGEWRAEVLTEGGTSTYQLSLALFTPQFHPDFGVSDVRVAKSTLRTDVLDSGVPGPTGAWTITARVTNLDASSWGCREVRFHVAATVDYRAAFPHPQPVLGGWHCLGPGQSQDVSATWQPFGALGDARVCARLNSAWDGNSQNDAACVADFVLVGGA